MGTANALAPETKAKIKELAAGGKGPAAISLELNIPKSTAADHIDHSSPRPQTDWTAERIATLEKLWQDGLSAGEITRHPLMRSFTRSAVIGKVHRLGLTRSADLNQQSRSRNCTGAHKGVLRPRRPKAEAQPRPKPKAVPAAILGPEAEASTVFGAVNPDPPVLRQVSATWSPANPVPMGDQRRGHCAWPIEIEGEPLKACNEPLDGRWCPAHRTIGTLKEPAHRRRDPSLGLGSAGWAPRRLLASRGGYE